MGMTTRIASLRSTSLSGLGLLSLLLVAACGDSEGAPEEAGEVYDLSAPPELALDLDESHVSFGPGEAWTMTLSVDNQFDVYFGTPWETVGERVGQGTKWKQAYSFETDGKNATDHLYIATTSDQEGAQGFIGVFTNLTRDQTVVTGDAVWQVFPAGAYQTTNPYWPDPWPKSVLPTQEQVDVAIAYAQENALWVEPTSSAAFDNDPATDPTDGTPWTWDPWEQHHDGIPNDALRIWYDSGRIEDGRIPGVFTGGNHDEFLVFRVVGNTVEQVTETLR